MIIVTVQFDIVGYTNYNELLRVFEKSVKHHMPEAKFEKIILSTDERTSDMQCGKYANTKKLATWVEYIDQAKENVILADCDMLMIRSAAHAFDEPFDIAYTRGLKVGKVPFNNGIMMIRPNERSRDFMHRWEEVNGHMYLDKAFHDLWNRKYKGMNQTAFGYLIETGEHNAHLHAYTTREWNAVDPDWPHIDEDTVFVHCKGQLRDAVIRGKSPLGSVIYPASLWYKEAGYEVPHQYRKLLQSKRSGATSVIVRKRLKRHADSLKKVEALLSEGEVGVVA